MSATGQCAQSLLVVEDDAATRKALSLVLEGRGYHVTTTAHGEEALRHLHSHAPPCLILLDLMMPVMDGWEFRSRLSADPALCSIPVVVLSAAGDLQQTAKTLAVADCFQKPVDLDNLLVTIRRYC